MPFGIGRRGGPERGVPALQFSDLTLEDSERERIGKLIEHHSGTLVPTFFIEDELKKEFAEKPSGVAEVIVTHIMDQVKTARETGAV